MLSWQNDHIQTLTNRIEATVTEAAVTTARAVMCPHFMQIEQIELKT